MAVTALVFSQLAVAAHACTLQEPADAAHAMEAAEPCDMGGDMADGMSNVCERHCHDAAKTQPANDLPAAQPVFIVALHPYVAPATPRGSPREPALQRAIAPPLTLTHCILRL
jgi:hypothetical protein